ncbi:uncharacterized protein LOC121976511 isoform X2 [Zingiber officinale]|uniref:uncharacterized protein LOC121976511 isoform X2 n=1 Tax=Zingiber officinale TaxID=94328 RepID=UPI001C4B5571|nr:uncharacterized protein LOC121976511 isoform X2 [Zingiber officinale]
MATQTPMVVQNENLHIDRGKGANVSKAVLLPKPAKLVRQDRKALRDLSKVGKPIVSGASKAPTLKKKTGFLAPESKVEPKGNYLTDEEIKQCQEWAKEGIEQVHFTGMDSRRLQQQKEDERVHKKVEKILAAMQEWIVTDYSSTISVRALSTNNDIAWDNEDLLKMELVPEELPLRTDKFCKLGDEEIKDFDWDFPLLEPTLELKLKEDDNYIQLLDNER